jgi:hypothetical protein
MRAREAEAAVERALRVRARPPGRRCCCCRRAARVGANGGVFTWAQLQSPLSRRLGAAPSSRVASTLAVRYAALSLCHQPQVVRCVLVLHRTPAPFRGLIKQVDCVCGFSLTQCFSWCFLRVCFLLTRTHFLFALFHHSPVPLLSVCLSLVAAKLSSAVVSLGVGCDDDSRGLVVSHVERLIPFCTEKRLIRFIFPPDVCFSFVGFAADFDVKFCLVGGS